LRGLKIADGLAEGLALGRIIDGLLDRRLADADAAHRLDQPFLNELSHDHDEVVTGRSAQRR
jgi:hypothetical protein